MFDLMIAVSGMDLNSQELVRGFVSSFLPHEADLAAVVCGSQVPLGSDLGEGISL